LLLKLPLSIHTLAALSLCAIASARAQSPPPQPTPSVVFANYNPDAISNYRENPKLVRAMVDRLVLAVTGQPDIAKAWSSLVAPNDKIGIKISAAGGELFTTHHAVVDAIVDGLVAAGHPRNSIIVWDRSLGGIKEAGYKPGQEGYQLRSISPRDGFDPQATLSAPVLGKLIWGDYEFNPNLGKMVPLSDTENTSNLSHFAKIVANDVTKIINVPVMSNSEMNGIAGCLYNVTIPNIDNWRRFSQATPFGLSGIADIYADPHIGKKVVLNIMDGLVAEYGGGPKAQPNFSIHHATIYASKDPVAIDAIAHKHIEKWRANASLPPIGPRALYIETASQMGLGNSTSGKIDIRNIGRAANESE
jgi:uncharacterized protein (DUF362 family)